MTRTRIALFSAAAVIAAAAAAGFFYMQHERPASAPGGTSRTAAARNDPAPILSGLQQILVAYRKIIVLLGNQKNPSARGDEPADRVGQALFHDNLTRNAA